MREPIEMISDYMENSITDAETAELESWLLADSSHLEIFARCLQLHSLLRDTLAGEMSAKLNEAQETILPALDRTLQLDPQCVHGEQDEATNANAAPDLIDDTRDTADRLLGDPRSNVVRMPGIRVEDGGEEQTLHAATSAIPPVSSAKPRWKLAALIGFPLLLGAILWIILRPGKLSSTNVATTHPEQGTVSAGAVIATASAVWDAKASPHDGRLPASGMLNLVSGLAQMRLENGVVLVAQGQARFGVVSKGVVALKLGKLTVTVPRAADGFVVETPSARVVDLGTEFGVVVDNSGNSEAHVIKGLVEIVPSGAAAGLRLAAASAARVRYGESYVQGIPCRAGDFVQVIMPIDLADVVAGGDGTQHLRGGGIDPTTGAANTASDTSPSRWYAANETTDGAFHPCPTRPLVGGTFVPHAGVPDQLDPARHRFAFPAGDGLTYLKIWSGTAPRVAKSVTSAPTVMKSVNYAGEGHSLITMHANEGITFDLQGIRKLHPDRPFSSLHAVCQNPSYGDSFLKGNAFTDLSELWVFVDGELRSHKLIHRHDPAFDLDVPVDRAARYLTIVATDGGDGYGWDWIALGDPQLR